MTKLNNSKCGKTQKLKCDKTQYVTKLQTQHLKTQKHKM